jgi:hypothetical protein
MNFVIAGSTRNPWVPGQARDDKNKESLNA